ncbi:pol II transcription elongation factor [Boletus reticuloceps]|uniref:Elongator complex protein 1 n=1 Tax=Boletus reticuloceps TaxID=495285 RepID=A0A8I3ADY7_9AGAM|nr:pol II transcription elongation factor [Boletus reticuloceps]
MRNLTLSTVQIFALQAEDVIQFSSPTSDDATAILTAIAFDLDRQTTFVGTESSQGVILIWRTSESDRVPQTSRHRPFVFCGSYTLPDAGIASLRVLSESNQLVLVTRAGDIVVWELDESGGFAGDADVLGTVESGIAAVAWSPDDSLMTLTTDTNVILMTSTFDVLSEVPIETNEFGEDAPINVGWGSKETQFHGSISRAHLIADKDQVDVECETLVDHGQPRITWRGDGAYFAVSSRSSRTRRVIRVYSREGRLQSTSQTVLGLEASIAWRPNGSLIASTQNEVRSGPQDARKSGKYDVVFFERNGLRHGEFSLRRPLEDDGSGYKVKDLVWSPDSAVLAVWIERSDGDMVQLWTTGNYHWYLKQEFRAPGDSHFTNVTWHPEASLRLLATTTSQLMSRTFAWETCAGANATGTVGVVDGDEVLLTPFRTQNVPPPLSSYQLKTSPATPSIDTSPAKTPVHIALSPFNDFLASVWQNGRVSVWSLNTRIGPRKEKIMNPALIWTAGVGDGEKVWRQVSVSDLTKGGKCAVRVALLGSERGSDHVEIHDVSFADASDDKPESEERSLVKMPGANGRLISSYVRLPPFWQDMNGEISEVDYIQDIISPLCTFPEHCFWATCIVVDDTRLFVGHAHSGKLYCVAPGSRPVLLANNATSFAIASGFVIFTTAAHDAQFVPVATVVQHTNKGDGPSLANGNSITQLSSDAWEKRRVERGSRIVTVVPSTMSLVLQMPRGNLETINPRPLVMEVVRADLDSGWWRKAFVSCRKHRIDLSIIVQHNQDAFMAGVSEFVDQVQDVDFINLFLTNVGRSQLTQKAITNICDAVRCQLETKDISKYVNSILTAHVVKSPPDHEAALSMLLQLRDMQPDLVEDAVKYVIFLVDADRLFDTALGMYDFSLVLMIAQHAQKDPREYLPFLRELRALPQYYQRFKIDDHLRRYGKALSNLNLAGLDYFQEALEYLERYQLYEEGLTIWRGTDKHQAILTAYGSWLFDRRDHKQAALAFVEAGDLRKAMIAHERALEWQELFDISTREKVPEEEVKEIAYRITGAFVKEASPRGSTSLIDYAGDIRQAVITLVQGNELSEARRIVSLHSTPELLEDVLLPGALEILLQLEDDLAEMRDQLRKQMTRLQELRIKKAEQPDAFYGTEDTNLHNVDVMTDVSMAPTAFTRYTAALSITSKTSKRSSKTKRKMERKVGSGRKGTVDEEEYLLKSISKLVARWTVTQGEIRKLLPHLLQFSKGHRAEGVALQQAYSAFDTELREAIEAVWKKPGVEQEEPVDSWAARMQEKDRERVTDPIERVQKPEMAVVKWELDLLRTKRGWSMEVPGMWPFLASSYL